MKFQSIVSFLALYLVSGLSAQINNNQSYEDAEYSNLQSGKYPARPPVKVAVNNGKPVSGTAGGKVNQNTTTQQQKPQQNGQKNNPARNQPARASFDSNNSKEGIRKQNSFTKQNLKAAQPTIINPRQPTRVNKPSAFPIAIGTPPYRNPTPIKVTQNAKTGPAQPVKVNNPNKNPKMSANPTPIKVTQNVKSGPPQSLKNSKLNTNPKMNANPTPIKVSQNGKTGPTLPVKNSKPNTNPKKTTNGPKKQSI